MKLSPSGPSGAVARERVAEHVVAYLARRPWRGFEIERMAKAPWLGVPVRTLDRQVCRAWRCPAAGGGGMNGFSDPGVDKHFADRARNATPSYQ